MEWIRGQFTFDIGGAREHTHHQREKIGILCELRFINIILI